MPFTQRTDNGLTYWVIGTAAWYGSEGEQLRAQGWRYCGYGTYGIIGAQGSNPCYTNAPTQEPNIGLPVQPDVGTPPGSTGPTGAVADKACGTCRKTTQQIQTPGAPAPTPGARPAPTAPKSKYPWWVLVLVALTLAQIVHGRNT